MLKHRKSMKAIKPLILSAGLVILFSGTVRSQDTNPDAVYLQLKKEYTLHADGTLDYRYSKKQKLLTYRAIHNLYGETFLVYNPEYQDLKINEAFTIMADGKKVTSPPNAFNEVLPSVAANAPAYNQLREMVVTHTGIERDATINLDYVLHSGKEYSPFLAGNEVFADTEPIEELTVIVRIPQGKTLSFRMFHSDLKPLITVEGSYTVYTWKQKNIPAIPAEEFQKTGNALYPRLIFSTAENRNVLYQLLVKQPAFGFEATGEMKNAIESVLMESREKTDIILKLQEKVVNDVVLWPIPMKYTGYRCRPAPVTWNSNGGTLMEKAVLLAALLREAGIPADPVFAIPDDFYKDAPATFTDVEDILVKAELTETGPVYLSLNSLNPQNLKYGNPGKTLVSLRRGSLPDAARAEEYRNRISVQGSFMVTDKKQLSGDISGGFLYNCNPWLTFLRDKNKAKTYFTGGLSPSDLKELKVATSTPDETFLTYKVQKETPFRKDSNYYTFTLPLVVNGIESWGMKLFPKSRQTPVEVPFLLEESYEYSIVLPAGGRLFTQAVRANIRNGTGAFLFEVIPENDKITVRKSIRIVKRIIDPADYPDFKEMMDAWNSEKYRKVIFIL